MFSKSFLFGSIVLWYGVICSSCFTRTEERRDAQKFEYELVPGWPELSVGYKLSQPAGIGIDTNQHIFIFHRAGRMNTTPPPDSLISMDTILELENETGRLINSWGSDQFLMPHGLTVDDHNNIWVTDVGLHQVFKFSHDGELLMSLGIPKTPGTDSIHFDRPTDVAVADDGSFFVSDGYGNSRIVKFSSSGKYLFQWGTAGSKQGEFNIPHGITLDNEGNLYVADRENNRIQVFDENGEFLKEVKNSEKVAQLTSVVLDDQYRIFATDYDVTDDVSQGSTVFLLEENRPNVYRFGDTAMGRRSGTWYHDISIDKLGNIYVGDIRGLKVLKFRRKLLL